MKRDSFIPDLVILNILFILVAVFAYIFIDFSIHPIEDAAMLMRYSKNLADGYGIVWNIGEPPVDGATDFLFMIAIAVLVVIGIPLNFATQFLGFSAHFFTIGLIYVALRKTFNAPRWVAFGSSLFLLAGPGFSYVSGYFGTTFFALFACLSWWIVLLIIKYGENRTRAILFSIMSLITGLIRPEGVILTGLMMLILIFIAGWKQVRLTFFVFLTIFLVFGGVYFLWRWSYFGYPLPNPFYIKHGSEIHLDGLFASFFHVFFMNLCFFPAFVAGLLYKATRRFVVGYLFLLFSFASFFVLITNYMNVGGRFQYVTFPISAMMCWPFSHKLFERFVPEKRNYKNSSILIAAFFILLGVAAKIEFGMYGYRHYYDGKYNVALMLSDYKEKGYRLVTTEAGLIPMYSGWVSLDAWGLNNQWIAHNGIISEEYLQEFNPHLIIFHAFFSPKNEPISAVNEWDQMVLVLKTFSEKNGFILAAAYGESPTSTVYYYVNPHFPDSAAIIRRIRETDYPSGSTGKLQENFAPDP